MITLDKFTKYQLISNQSLTHLTTQSIDQSINQPSAFKLMLCVLLSHQFVHLFMFFCTNNVNFYLSTIGVINFVMDRFYSSYVELRFTNAHIIACTLYSTYQTQHNLQLLDFAINMTQEYDNESSNISLHT